MSKELEVMNWYQFNWNEMHDLTSYKLSDDELKSLADYMTKTLIEQITYPTAGEVCKALSEYLKTPVEYNETFGFIANERVIIYKYLNNVLSFNTNYRPEIHTLIGRFYEGLEHV